MIRQIVSFAIHQPLFMVLLLALFVGAGIAAFHALPIEAFPDVSDIQVNVITLFPGRASEEVEKQVTIPVEVALAGVPHCVRLFSHTQFGLSFIVVTFNDRPTDYFARQLVIERLREAELPAGVNPELAALAHDAMTLIPSIQLAGGWSCGRATWCGLPGRWTASGPVSCRWWPTGWNGSCR